MDKQHTQLVTFDVLLSLFTKLHAPVHSPEALEERKRWLTILNRWINHPEVFVDDSVRQAAITHRDLWFPRRADQQHSLKGLTG